MAVVLNGKVNMHTDIGSLSKPDLLNKKNKLYSRAMKAHSALYDNKRGLMVPKNSGGRESTTGESGWCVLVWFYVCYRGSEDYRRNFTFILPLIMERI